MSPWTAFLQSLHSALIDEITERHPEPKPELGMPVRHSQLKSPVQGLDSFFIVDVTIGGTEGLALLACQSSFLRAAGIPTLEALWNEMMKRAGSEFMRHAIKPTVGQGKTSSAIDTDLSRASSIQKFVWIPLKLGEASGFFGIGA